MKSSFILERKAPPNRAVTIRNIPGYTQADPNVPFDYLGMPLFQGRTIATHFLKLLEKTRAKIDGWRRKILSMGGKMVLISYVLSNMPMYKLSVFAIPKKVLRSLENMFPAFLWGSFQGKLKKRWKSWQSMELPREDGGLGFRSIRIVMQEFRMKTT